MTGSVEQWVERLAGLAYDSGIRGIVASTKELPMLRRKFQDETAVRDSRHSPGRIGRFRTRSRTATPAEAIRAGADFIVVGRPILQAPDPAAAADAIVEEMRRALPV